MANGDGSRFDPARILKNVYDPSSNTIKTSATAAISNMSINVDIDKDEDSIETFQTNHDNLNANVNLQVNNTDVSNANPVPISDGGSSITVDGTVSISNFPATQPVSVSSLPLPNGAATQTTLSSVLTELQLKADLTETQPVSVNSLPLPSGAATIQATIIWE